MTRLYRTLSWLLPVLAFIVIVKGAYVRLTDAGLGCPDWPGCYGQLLVPASPADAQTTPFTPCIDARYGITTGISAADRVRTVQVAIDERDALKSLADRELITQRG